MKTPNNVGYIEEDISPGGSPERVSLRYLLRFIGPDRTTVGVGIGLLVIANLLGLVGAVALGQLIEAGLMARDSTASIQFAGAVLGAELLAVLAAFGGKLMLARGASRTLMRIRTALIHHIYALPLSYYDRQPLGRTVTRISHDVESLDTFFGGSLGRIALATLSIVTSVAAMIITSPSFGGILVAATLPAIACTVLTRHRAGELNRRLLRANSAINARLAEYLNGIPVIRAFGLEAWSGREFRRAVEGYLASGINMNRFYSALRPVSEFCCQLPLLALIVIGGHATLSGSLAVGVFVTLARYCQRFSGPITELSREIVLIQEARVTCERVSAFLNAPTEASELGPDGERSARGARGAIEFAGVTMAYPSGEAILSDVSFTIAPGTRIGLAGATGAGKTTVVSLVARLYEFQRGEIRLDGVSIREYARASLRETIGFVSQDVVIVAGTVAENIASGRAYDRAAIELAAERTGLSAVLARSGRTLDDVVLDRGANISAGERQLIALTRVLVAAPAILILDEATAHIDPALEQTIHAAVDTVMSGRTCLIIAHRLATLEKCDRVLVFKDGRIVEEGPPSAVLTHPIELPADDVAVRSTTPPSPAPETSVLDIPSSLGAGGNVPADTE